MSTHQPELIKAVDDLAEIVGTFAGWMAMDLGADGVRVLLDRIRVVRQRLAKVAADSAESAGEADEKCEGCSAPATRYDCDMVPLCEACWKSLIEGED